MVENFGQQVYRLPSDCVYKIVRRARDDLSILYSLSLVNRTWWSITIKYLYQNPWSYFPQENWNQTGQSKRIAQLLSTLFSPLGIEPIPGNYPDQSLCTVTSPISNDKKYIENLTVLDLFWIKRAFRLTSAKKFGQPRENFSTADFPDLAKQLVSFIMKYKPRQLEKLTLLDCQMIELLNISNISLVSLNCLDIRQREFGNCAVERICELCPNLVQLKITALLVDDVVTATLIKCIKKNTLNKLCINGLLKSVTLVISILTQYQQDSLEEFSLDMNPGNAQEDVVDPFNNSGISELYKFSNLQSLILKGMYIDTEMLKEIAQQCNHLSKVHLSGPYVATGAVEMLISNSGSRLLELVVNIEERCLGRVLLLLKQCCPRLKKLDIRGMEFDCDQITQLAASCSNLVHVVLGYPLYASTKAYNEMALSLITNCENLEYLNLNQVYIGPQIIQNLLNHSRLKKIVLPISLLRLASFSSHIVEFKTVILGDQEIFELYIKPT